jgi:hypothetical protein
MQFDALWSSTSKTLTNNKAYIVETCDGQIAQGNDHLKREVKKLELEVNKLKKQAKVQHSQDNRNNIVKKLKKGKTAPKIASQPPKRQVQKEMDKIIEYARSAF